MALTYELRDDDLTPPPSLLARLGEACAERQERGAAFGAKSSLIAWLRFCANEIQTQGRPEGPPPEAVNRRASADALRFILYFEFRSRTAPPCNQWGNPLSDRVSYALSWDPLNVSRARHDEITEEIEFSAKRGLSGDQHQYVSRALEPRRSTPPPRRDSHGRR